MTNPRLEQIARRQMGPQIPAQDTDKQEKYVRITCDSGKVAIPILMNDYLALKAVLSKVNENVEDYLSKMEGIIEGGRVVKLFLGYSKIESVGEEIGSLGELRYLNLYGNQLTALPESFGKLIMLKELNLGLNHLKSVPESIFGLKGLEELGLSDNPLTELPEFLVDLPKLTIIWLTEGIKAPKSLHGRVEYGK